MYNSGNSSKNVTGSSIVDGTVEAADLATAVNNDIADGVAGKATADLALPKTGGTMTGTIAGFTSTGIDDNATSTAITIDANENVGVGTTSPASALHVVDSGNPTLTISGSDGAYTSILKLQAAGGGSSIINATGATSDNLILQTNDTERMRVTNNGITFNGDTAAANALDDYEEGTWTPELEFGGATTGITYNNRIGSYTKTGNVVTVFCKIHLTSKGTATGSAQISGLPYNANAGGYVLQTFIANLSFTYNDKCFAVINGSSTVFELHDRDTSRTDESDFSNGAYLTINASFIIQ
jgi:hypothetical protein